jgi:hypothetical protein
MLFNFQGPIPTDPPLLVAAECHLLELGDWKLAR